ncbi:MAG: nucleotidyltransferase family protein [Candidatus Omnitrophica bacterium]|nr:nucleotidyltransferase family protein [Candidatus Omnitrophota bacterium]
MKIVLLCAGYATRLYPLTKDQPKPLLPISGKPLLEYLLEELKELSLVDGIYLVTNGRFYPHFEKWASGKRYPWKIEVVNDGTKTNETRRGAIGDLLFVVERFKIHDDLGVFAGDNFFQFDLRGFKEFAESHRPHTSIGVVNVESVELAKRYGIVRADEERRIIDFYEKPEKPPSTLASTGVYWFSKESLDLLDRYVEEGHNADRPGDYICWLVKVDRVYAYPFEGKWFDIGDLASYQQAEIFLKKGATKK